MTKKGTRYFLNENDRRLVDETIRKTNTRSVSKPKPRTAIGAPPIRFGIVQADWSIGDSTVSVLPARFDDFTSSLSGTQAISVYVMYHQYGRYIDDKLTQNSVVPYIPFQGEDSNGVQGIVAGQLLAKDYNPFAAQYTEDSGSPAITINDGDVYYEGTSPTTVAGGATVYPLDTTTYFYVEIEITPGEDIDPSILITSTIQTSASPVTYWNYVGATGVLTIKWQVARIDGTNQIFYQNQIGDIYLKSLYTPGFNTDIQGDALNEGVFAAIKTATSSLDGKSYFYEGRKVQKRYTVGEMVKYTLGDAFKFGGVNSNDSFDFLDEVDIATEDEVTLKFGSIDYDVDSGLTQQLEDGVPALTGVKLSALGKWIGILAGQTYHKNSPVTSDTDAEHWDTLVVSKDGGGTYTIYIDDKGHIWKIDSDEQPPPPENYRYTHCSDPLTYSDIILGSAAATNYIRVADECYEFADTTEDDTTGETVSATFASCAACEGSVTNEQWKDCDTDTNQAVLTETHTDVDYAWLCISGNYLKCYNDSLTSATATDPTVLKQCGLVGDPTACSQLTGFPAKDDFSDTDCNSGSVTGPKFGVKWTQTNSDGTASVTSNLLRMVTNAGTGAIMRFENNAVLTGNGTCTVKVTISTSNTDPTVAGGRGCHLQLFTEAGSFVGQIRIAKEDADSSSVWRIVTDPGDVDITTSYSSSTIWLRMVRSGTTVTMYYSSNGTSYTNTGQSFTQSGNVQFRLLAFSNTSGATVTGDWDDFELEDGSSNDIIIDPEDLSCT